MRFENPASLPQKTERRETKRRESNEVINQKLKTLLATMAEKYNLDLKNFIPEDHNYKKKIILADGSINMNAFAKGKEKGPYSRKDSFEEGITSIRDDKDFNKERELDWSGLDNPKTQSFYKDEYKCKNLEEMLAKYHENKEKENGIILEKVMTILLDRYLGDKYLVLRTATYDDYANGIDNLIINKTTGETICAFDGLNEEFDNKRRDKKLKKVKNQTRKGGGKIKYGLSIKDGILEKKELKNLPIFYLSLTKSELNLLINNLNPDLNSPITNEEENILNKIFNSFNEQAEDLLSEGIAKGQIAKNIKTFQETIKTISK